MRRATLLIGAMIGLLCASSASAATNLLQNSSLESASGSTPSCWAFAGGGSNGYTWSRVTTAHTGTYAESLQVSKLYSGDRELISAEDAGTCAPAATPGATYTVGAWFKAPSRKAGSPKFFAFYRDASGAWKSLASSSKLSAHSSWTYLSWTTPALPSDATYVSAGAGLAGTGGVTMDDFTLQSNAPPASPTPPPSDPPPPSSSLCPAPGAQTTWAAPGTAPLSDAQAAACVVHQPETRLGNAQYNDYVPTDAQLQAFHSALRDDGLVADSVVPERRYVTGRPGLANPSTDDLIQWVAHKWGIPEDWIRAQMAVESWWKQGVLGDRATVSSSWYSLYPPQAQVAGTSDVYQSMGISQIKWRPDGSDGPGTEPLRWESTAFALDLVAARIRWFYNGECSWCAPGYSAGQQWNSIGGWYEPNPWGNSGQASYIAQVQNDLAGRVWAQPGF
jgi:hypothetical protein